MNKLMMYTTLILMLNSCMLEPTIEFKLDGPTKAIIGPDSNLYIGDGYYNSRIVVFNLSGKFIRSWGARGYAEGQFQNPHGLAFSKEGSLFIADRDNGRIQVFNTNGDFLTEWHSDKLGRPWDIAVVDDGSVFSIDGGDQDTNNPRSGIVKLSPNGEIICRFSSFGSKSGELNWPHSIAVSNNGTDVFVVDLNNSRIQKYVATTSEKNQYDVQLEWPILESGQTLNPLGIAVSNTTVFVTQKKSGSPIILFDNESGKFIKEIAEGIFEYAHGISIDEYNTIWVTDKRSNKVFRLNMNGEILLTIGKDN